MSFVLAIRIIVRLLSLTYSFRDNGLILLNSLIGGESYQKSGFNNKV